MPSREAIKMFWLSIALAVAASTLGCFFGFVVFNAEGRYLLQNYLPDVGIGGVVFALPSFLVMLAAFFANKLRWGLVALLVGLNGLFSAWALGVYLVAVMGV